MITDMKKLVILALLAVIIAGCYSHNPSGEEQIYLVTRLNGDTLSIKASEWNWSYTRSEVLFHSNRGTQYVSDVKDIILKEK